MSNISDATMFASVRTAIASASVLTTISKHRLIRAYFDLDLDRLINIDYT